MGLIDYRVEVSEERGKVLAARGGWLGSLVMEMWSNKEGFLSWETENLPPVSGCLVLPALLQMPGS